jgi:hypothetical protein
VHFIKEDLFDSGKFNLKDIVYLTPGADEVIEDIDPEKVYVIGGEIPVTEDFTASKNEAFDGKI